MAKRQRSDSVKAETEAMAAAFQGIDPPDWVRMPESALPFWKSIVTARAAAKWNNTDLEAAAELSRTKASIERLNEELEIEGDIIKNDRGTPIVNPKHSLLETLNRRMVSLSRFLQVHAEATQGKSRDQVKGNQSQSKANDQAETLQNQDDGLIATPKH